MLVLVPPLRRMETLWNELKWVFYVEISQNVFRYQLIGGVRFWNCVTSGTLYEDFGIRNGYLGYGKVITFHGKVWYITIYPWPGYLFLTPKFSCKEGNIINPVSRTEINLKIILWIQGMVMIQWCPNALFLFSPLHQIYSKDLHSTQIMYSGNIDVFKSWYSPQSKYMNK